MPHSDSKILEDISTSIPGVIYQFLVRADGRWSFPYISRGIEILFEVTPEEVYDDADVMTWCILEEDRPGYRQSVGTAVTNRTPWHHEHRILTRSGVTKWILSTALPRQLEDGSSLWNGILTDITELMESKRAATRLNTIHEQQMQAIARTEAQLRAHHNLLAQQICTIPLLSSAKLKILIVEDEVLLRDALVRIFTHLNYDIRGVGNGKDMDAALAEYSADIIVLDIGLPGEDGIQLSQRIRNVSLCGIIMMTGHSQLDKKLSAYECGADIYFSKPVDPEELHAAIESLGRRLSPSSKPGWYLDGTRSLLVTPRNICIPLTSQQAIVLKLLCTRHGESIPRSEILTALGQSDDHYADQRLETLLSRLRAKVRAMDPESELPLRARQNAGYAFLDLVL